MDFNELLPSALWAWLLINLVIGVPVFLIAGPLMWLVVFIGSFVTTALCVWSMVWYVNR